MERSLDTAGRVVAAIDREALAQRRAPSLALVKAVLAGMQ
jgi:hypothetical protein